LLWTALFVSIGIVVVYFTFTLLVCYGSLVRSVHSLLVKIHFARLDQWFSRKAPRFEELHCSFEELGEHGGRRVLIAGLEYTAIWILEIIETYVVLRVLGANLSLGEASLVEIVATLMRSAAFIVPGGIGVQDTGYATMLLADGESAGFIATFIVLKRLREALWAVLGYTFLWTERTGQRKRPTLHSPAQSPLRAGDIWETSE
jgi:uncharacterized membrane protein YbhN (UPF0104 family)